jgi:hypothetical protein
MSNILERLKASLASGEIDPALLPEAVAEIADLRTRQNELEKIVITLVRTGWPWDEDGEPNEIFRTSKDGYAAAMVKAKELLGLDQRSMITRTEPRT